VARGVGIRGSVDVIKEVLSCNRKAHRRGGRAAPARRSRRRRHRGSGCDCGAAAGRLSCRHVCRRYGSGLQGWCPASWRTWLLLVGCCALQCSLRQLLGRASKCNRQIVQVAMGGSLDSACADGMQAARSTSWLWQRQQQCSHAATATPLEGSVAGYTSHYVLTRVIHKRVLGQPCTRPLGPAQPAPQCPLRCTAPRL
jgi:hypothetical protein